MPFWFLLKGMERIREEGKPSRPLFAGRDL